MDHESNERIGKNTSPLSERAEEEYPRPSLEGLLDEYKDYLRAGDPAIWDRKLKGSAICLNARAQDAVTL